MTRHLEPLSPRFLIVLELSLQLVESSGCLGTPRVFRFRRRMSRNACRDADDRQNE